MQENNEDKGDFTIFQYVTKSMPQLEQENHRSVSSWKPNPRRFHHDVMIT